MPGARVHSIVLYTTRVEACRDFYAGLGLEFTRERHGEKGLEHYAAVLDGGGVFEIYPATPARVTGALRIGLYVDGAAPPGRRVLRDPDGRAVDVGPPEAPAATPEAS